MAEKRCLSCGSIQPIEEFHKLPTMVDGRNPRCKICINAAKRAKYANGGGQLTKKKYYNENRAEILSKASHRRKVPKANKKLVSEKMDSSKKSGLKSRRFGFLFTPEQVTAVNDYKSQHDLNSFSAAFRAMVSQAITEQSYFKFNAFDWSLSHLVENRRQIVYLYNNLNQFLNLYELGRLPDFSNHIDRLKQLFHLCNDLKIDLHKLITSIQSNTPQ